MEHAISYTPPKKQQIATQLETENQTSVETSTPLDQQLDT
jgi:hypothetical protein